MQSYKKKGKGGTNQPQKNPLWRSNDTNKGEKASFLPYLYAIEVLLS